MEISRYLEIYKAKGIRLTETGGTIVEPIPCSGVKMAVDSDNDDKQY